MNFNLKSYISNIFQSYKSKTQDHRKNLGVLSLIKSLKKHDVILSRCFLRDKDQMNRGYNDFNKDIYSSFVSKTILDLPDYDSGTIAKDIYSQLNNVNEVTIVTSQCYEKTIDDVDEEDGTEDTDTDYNDTILLMAQLGLPTAFTSTKSKKGTKNNSRNKKLQDLDMIFECIKDHVMSLLSDDNELIKHWIMKQQKEFHKFERPSNRIFCTNLLSSDSINNETQEMIKSFLENECLRNEIEEDFSENDLLRSFHDTIDGYVDRKCIDWFNDLNLSDNYKSTITFENTELAEYLLSSLGLAYQTVIPTESYKLYPIISAKSVVYSLKHDLSLYNGEFDDNEQESLDDDPMNKYYFQRYRFFDQFDEGILLDDESWYSVTPAIIAEHHATRFKRLLTDNKPPVVIDAFSGAGGNAIRFATQGFIVLAIDIDQQKLKMLLHNAGIYGVAANIVPICHDYFDLVNWMADDRCPAAISALFSLAIGVNISPPWGGPEYLDKDVFDINVMDFDAVMSAAHKWSDNIACFIPRQSNCSQILSWLTDNAARLTVRYSRIEIEQNCVHNKMKALTLYTNELAQSPHLVFI